jgi:hypothetical protein
MVKMTKKQVKANTLPSKKEVMDQIRKDWGDEISKLYEEDYYGDTRRELEKDET